MTLNEYEEMYERHGYDGDEPVWGLKPCLIPSALVVV